MASDSWSISDLSSSLQASLALGVGMNDSNPSSMVIVHTPGDPSVCVFCDRTEEERPILVPERGPHQTATGDSVMAGICEPCALLAGWRWRQETDEVATPPFRTTPDVVTVLIVRPRTISSLTTVSSRASGETVDHQVPVDLVDPTSPYDVLMVTRKEEYEAWALPGGKVEWGESPEAAAVRELTEETGLVSWPSSFEVLHEAYTARGRLMRVYLCRVYSGSPVQKEEGVEVAWKPYPILQHCKSYKGFYVGVENALGMRSKIQDLREASVPMSIHLGKAALAYATLQEQFAAYGSLSEEDRNLQSGFFYAMTEAEKTAVSILGFGKKQAVVQASETKDEDEDEADAAADDESDDNDGVPGEELET